MVDPFSLFTGVGLASFVGNMLYDGAKSAGKEIAKKKIDAFKGEALARVAGAYGLATNHDAEKAIRRAQMAALRYLLTEYEKNLPASDEGGGQFVAVFTDAGFAFADECTRKCDRETLELRDDVISALEESLSATLASAPVVDLEARAAALRQAAAQAVFDELQADLASRTDTKTGKPIVIPAGFRTLFFDGGTAHDEKRIENWHDAFILQAAKALKGADPKFEKIFAATHLARSSEIALDTNEIVRLTQEVVSQSALLLAQNAHRLAAIEAALARAHAENMAAHDKTHDKLDEVLRLMQQDQARKAGLDPRVLAPIFERLGKKDLTVEDMQAQAEAAVTAFLAYVDGRIEKTNLGEDIDSAIAEARELLRQTGLAGAENRLDAGISKEDRAIADAQELLRDHVARKVALLAEKAEMRRVMLDYAGARAALGEILAVDPANGRALVERGDIERVIGMTDAALADFHGALALARSAGGERQIGVALERIGDVLVARNDLDGALEHYEEGLEISRRLAKADPTHAERARDVSVSVNKIAGALVARDDLDGALQYYSEDLEISRRLAEADPSNAGRSHDVAISLMQIGSVHRSRDDRREACANFKEAHAIVAALAARAPDIHILGTHLRMLDAIIAETCDSRG